MLKDYKNQALVGIWGGIFFSGFGYLLTSASSVLYVNFGYLILTGGYVLFVLGCFMYSRGKGYSWIVGMLGFLGPVGLLLLYCLKDHSKRILAKQAKEAQKF